MKTKSWQNISGWFDFQDIYDKVVAQAKDDDVFIEIGTCLGKSACYMGQKIKESGKKINFITIDIFQPPQDEPAIIHALNGKDMLDVCTQNIEDCDVDEYVEVVRADSAALAQSFDDNSVDFIFIDGDHRYWGVMRDISMWYRKLKPGKLMAGHDYPITGVKVAVDSIFRAPYLTGRSWQARKTITGDELCLSKWNGR